LFGSCIIHILNTGVLKFEKKISRQRVNVIRDFVLFVPENVAEVCDSLA
jgi:hypothetical protein